MEWYLKVIKENYANFKGRARRKEYWMFFLVNFIISIVLMGVDRMLGLTFEDQGLISSIYSLAVFIPGIAVTVRRLHDTGKSGWNYLWVLTCIGVFYVLYLLVIEGDKGPNEYGPDPKSDDADDPFAGQRDEPNPFVNPNQPNNPFNDNN